MTNMGRLLSSVLYEAYARDSERGQVLAHWCDGCMRVHLIAVEKPDDRGAVWAWDGDRWHPSIAPSVDAVNGFCRYTIRRGMVDFQQDCKHALAGMLVPMPPWHERRKHERIAL